MYDQKIAVASRTIRLPSEYDEACMGEALLASNSVNYTIQSKEPGPSYICLKMEKYSQSFKFKPSKRSKDEYRQKMIDNSQITDSKALLLELQSAPSKKCKASLANQKLLNSLKEKNKKTKVDKQACIQLEKAKNDKKNCYKESKKGRVQNQKPKNIYNLLKAKAEKNMEETSSRLEGDM